MTGLSGRLWPWHPKPKPDESLSSWLRRTAGGNSPTLHDFTNRNWPERQVWSIDLDKHAPPEVLDLLACRTATSPERAWSTTLRAYEGVLFETIPTAGAAQWILKAGVYNRDRRGFGQQWCSLCLREDEQPYYRRRWRLALASTCPHHGVLLADRCEGCGAACVPHKGEDPFCHVCGFDRRLHRTEAADTRALTLEHRLAAMLEHDAAPWTELEAMHPLAYFGVVHHVYSTLVRGPKGTRLREVTARVWGGDPRAPDSKGQEATLESLGVQDRHRLAGLAARLLEGWPWLFVGACAEAGLWRTWAFGNRRYDRAPYAFARPVIDYLTYPRPAGAASPSQWRYERAFHLDNANARRARLGSGRPA